MLKKVYGGLKATLPEENSKGQADHRPSPLYDAVVTQRTANKRGKRSKRRQNQKKQADQAPKDQFNVNTKSGGVAVAPCALEVVNLYVVDTKLAVTTTAKRKPRSQSDGRLSQTYF